MIVIAAAGTYMRERALAISIQTQADGNLHEQGHSYQEFGTTTAFKWRKYFGRAATAGSASASTPSTEQKVTANLAKKVENRQDGGRCGSRDDQFDTDRASGVRQHAGPRQPKVERADKPERVEKPGKKERQWST